MVSLNFQIDLKGGPDTLSLPLFVAITMLRTVYCDCVHDGPWILNRKY